MIPASLLNQRYQLLELLGEGGMATVYRGHDTLLNRAIAVKILKEEHARDPAFVARFRREAQAAARLSHPGIVAIYDVGEADGRPYIVMEYVPGETLKQLIQRQAPLDLETALELMLQVSSAVAAAHAAGIVHRDLKPQNILVATSPTGPGSRPPGLTVKVTDFGLARSVTVSAQSEAGVVFGTAHYLAPEQARGEAATPASDVYALGIVFYELVTGQLPFTGDTALAIALQHVQSPPPSPRQLNPRLPSAVERIILVCLSKAAEQRYSSAGELHQVLSEYRALATGDTVGQQPVIAPRPTPPPTRPEPSPPLAEDRQRSPGRPAGCAWPLLALALIIVGFALLLVPFGLLVTNSLFTPTPTPVPPVSVPDLVGLDIVAASNRATAVGLRVNVIDSRYDDQAPVNTVLVQMIAKGTPVLPGTIVDVVLSRGKETVVVPNVVNLTFAAAQERLTQAGLRVSRVDLPDPVVISGTVSRQEPVAESRWPRGSVVTVTVSLGNKVIVPDLFALPEAEAQARIRNAGLNTTWVNPQLPEDVPPSERWKFEQVCVGCVISQTPPAGSLVDRGTVIYLATRKR